MNTSRGINIMKNQLIKRKCYLLPILLADIRDI